MLGKSSPETIDFTIKYVLFAVNVPVNQSIDNWKYLIVLYGNYTGTMEHFHGVLMELSWDITSTVWYKRWILSNTW